MDNPTNSANLISFTVLQNGNALIVGGTASQIIQWVVTNHAKINQARKGRIELHFGPGPLSGGMYEILDQPVTGSG